MTDDALAASVVVPVRDAAGALGRQLDALARQSAPFAWEVLVCDNGSTDGTLDVVRGYAGRLPQLRVVDASARRGAAAARNVGAAAARSPLLLFCDADDEVGEGWLVAVVEALGSADAVAGSRRYDRVNAEPFGPDDWTEPLFTVPYLPALPAASSNNLGVRKAVFDEVGGYDEALRTGEDVDLCWRVQRAGYRLVGEPRAVVDVRRRTGVLAVFRQSYAYGRGDAALLRKHADLVGRAAAVLPEPPRANSPAANHRSSGLRRALSRLVRFRSPVNLRFAAARAGRWLGRRRGAVR